MNDKIMTLGELKKTVGRLRQQGRRIVFTNGCFDILHVGHVCLLQQALTPVLRGRPTQSAYLIVACGIGHRRRIFIPHTLSRYPC